MRRETPTADAGSLYFTYVPRSSRTDLPAVLCTLVSGKRRYFVPVSKIFSATKNNRQIPIMTVSILLSPLHVRKLVARQHCFRNKGGRCASLFLVPGVSVDRDVQKRKNNKIHSAVVGIFFFFFLEKCPLLPLVYTISREKGGTGAYITHRRPACALSVWLGVSTLCMCNCLNILLSQTLLCSHEICKTSRS